MDIPSVQPVSFIQDIMKSGNVGFFLGGVVVGAAAVTILGSKTARDIAVAGVAEGMRIRDDVISALNGIQEDAQDLYTEKQLAASAEVAEVDYEDMKGIPPVNEE